MSSFPGSSLEDLIEDMYGHYTGSITTWDLAYNVPPPELFQRLVAFYEPHRETLEWRAREFPGDEEASWRDYRTVVWDDIPRAGDEVFRGYKFVNGKYLPTRLTLILGDSKVAISQMPPCSVDSLVTDPPAGISLMSKEWDKTRNREQWVDWMQGILTPCLGVLKPGAHGLVWSLPRRLHWTALALEDSGFEVRDVITHIFGTGFPKSQDLGGGLGTSLKPSSESWVLVRKPPRNSLPENLATWGTGGLNIDSCLVGGKRHPSNLLFSHHSDCKLLGEKKVKAITGGNSCAIQKNVFGKFGQEGKGEPCGYGDQGFETVPLWECTEECAVRKLETQKKDGSRFFECLGGGDFHYAPKASKKDRGPDNTHPTVKGQALMNYLVRLVTPEGGVVLDPFMGSGSTGVAAVTGGYSFIGVEKELDYYLIAQNRIRGTSP